MNRPLHLMLAASLSLSAIRCASAQPAPHDGPDGPPPPPPTVQPTTQASNNLSGSVEAFNYNSHGLPESMMLKTANGTVQVNFPPEIETKVQQNVQLGGEVKAMGAFEPSTGDHPIYHLTQLRLANGEKVQAEDRTTPKTVHVDSTVKRLNYGRRGEANGLQLDSGDLVHVPPPDLAELKLSPGDKVSIDGMTHGTMGDHQIIGANKINGTEIKPPPPPGQNDNNGPNGRGPRPRRPMGDGNTDQRGARDDGKPGDGPRDGPRPPTAAGPKGDGSKDDHDAGPVMPPARP